MCQRITTQADQQEGGLVGLLVRQAREWLAKNHPRLWRCVVLYRPPELQVHLLVPRTVNDMTVWWVAAGSMPVARFSWDGEYNWKHPDSGPALDRVRAMFPSQELLNERPTPEQLGRLMEEMAEDARAIDYRPLETVPEDYYAG